MTLRTTTFFISLTAFALFSCDRIGPQVDMPPAYSFERNGASTVSFSGQTHRLAMGGELNEALKDQTSSIQLLQEMFANEDANGNNVDPFVNPDLNASNKSIRSKVAASYGLFSDNNSGAAAIKTDFDLWLAAQVTDIYTNADSLAAPGKAGQIADGTTPRYVNGKGIEYNELVIKGLIGALVTDQMLHNYLNPSVLDEGMNRENQLSETTEEGKNYTTMEHKWDEAYGYLFGGTPDPSNPEHTLGEDDVFMNKYLSRVTGDPDFSTYFSQIFDAFKLGRAAIVAGEFELRDEQAAIIKERISEVIAIRAVYYLKTGGIEIAASNFGSAFHDLSEGYGFIYSLQFTHNPATGMPYFSAEEVEAMLTDLMDDGANGLWDVQITTLDDLAATIASRFNFTVDQTLN